MVFHFCYLIKEINNIEKEINWIDWREQPIKLCILVIFSVIITTLNSGGPHVSDWIVARMNVSMCSEYGGMVFT